MKYVEEPETTLSYLKRRFNMLLDEIEAAETEVEKLRAEVASLIEVSALIAILLESPENKPLRGGFERYKIERKNAADLLDTKTAYLDALQKQKLALDAIITLASQQ